MWYGLFIFFGWFIKVAFDYLDKGMIVDRTPAGKKTIKSWILGLIVAGLFYVVNIFTTIEDRAKDDDVILAVILLCFAFIGYLAPHLFLKGSSFFKQRADAKLGGQEPPQP